MRLQTIMCQAAAAALSCALYVGAGYTPAAAAPAAAEVQAAAPALMPVTVADHDETLTMLLPQVPAFEHEEQAFAEIGFAISKYLARIEGTGLDLLIQHSVFGDDGSAPPTLDEATVGAREAIAAAYRYDRMTRDETVMLGDMPAHLFSYTYTVGGTRYIDDSILVTLGSNQWNITLTRRADAAAAQAHIDEILMSVRVRGGA